MRMAIWQRLWEGATTHGDVDADPGPNREPAAARIAICRQIWEGATRHGDADADPGAEDFILSSGLGVAGSGSARREEQRARGIGRMALTIDSERENRVDASAILATREKSLVERCLGQQSPKLATLDALKSLLEMP
jgi:hypothetical protein